MAKKFANITGLWTAFTYDSTKSKYVINDIEAVKAVINENTIAFITTDDKDIEIFGLGANRKYIITQGILFNCNDSLDDVLLFHDNNGVGVYQQNNFWEEMYGLSASVKPKLAILRTNVYDDSTDNRWVAGRYAPTLSFGVGDTLAAISAMYDIPIISFAGGNVAKSTESSPYWYFKIKGENSATYDLANNFVKLEVLDDLNNGRLNYFFESKTSDNNTLNMPTADWYNGITFAANNNSNFKRQIATNGSNIYIRQLHAEKWLEWNKLITNDYLFDENGWINLTANPAGNGLVKWNKIATITSTLGNPALSDLTFEFFGQGDRNYAWSRYGKIIINSYATLSRDSTFKVASFNANMYSFGRDFDFKLKIVPTSTSFNGNNILCNVYLGVGGAWSCHAKMRILHHGSNVLIDTSPISQDTAPSYSASAFKVPTLNAVYVENNGSFRLTYNMEGATQTNTQKWDIVASNSVHIKEDMICQLNFTADNIKVHNDVNVSGDILVRGDSTLEGNVYISGDLEAQNEIKIGEASYIHECNEIHTEDSTSSISGPIEWQKGLTIYNQNGEGAGIHLDDDGICIWAADNGLVYYDEDNGVNLDGTTHELIPNWQITLEGRLVKWYPGIEDGDPYCADIYSLTSHTHSLYSLTNHTHDTLGKVSLTLATRDLDYPILARPHTAADTTSISATVFTNNITINAYSNRLLLGDESNTTSSWTPSYGGIGIRDLRGCTVTPDNICTKSFTAYFTQYKFDNSDIKDWTSVLHMKGWSTGYRAWELAASAATQSSTHSTGLFYRNGASSNSGSTYSWSSWSELVLHDKAKTITPNVNKRYDLGSGDKQWQKVYANTYVIGDEDEDEYTSYISLSDNAGNVLMCASKLLKFTAWTISFLGNNTNFRSNISVTGRIDATEGFFHTSDIRKKNILGEIDLDKCYGLLETCLTILYELKDDEDHKLQIGAIAQEVKEFFPEIVSGNDEDGYTLDYSKLSIVCLRLIKDLANRVKKLEEK